LLFGSDICRQRVTTFATLAREWELFAFGIYLLPGGQITRYQKTQINLLGSACSLLFIFGIYLLPRGPWQKPSTPLSCTCRTARVSSFNTTPCIVGVHKGVVRTINCKKNRSTERHSGWLSILRRCLPRRWPGFDSRSQPDPRLERKRWLFFVTLRQGARSQALQFRL
jgi:hypothetical protein